MNAKPSQTVTTIQPPSTVSPMRRWHDWLIGRPLSSADAPNETVGKLIGLAWALHNQTAFLLRMSLILRPGIVIVEVPYQVE